MTALIFGEWLLLLDKRMKKEKRKIVLLVDNCSAHNNAPKLDNVELCFFPPNCTSIIQPLDMGIIKNFKVKYRTKLIERVIINLERKVENPFKINVKQACDMISSSWLSVQEKTIRNCWRKAKLVNSEECDHVDYEKDPQDDPHECLQLYEKLTGKKIDVPVDDYVSVDNCVSVFTECSDESIITELMDEKKAGGKDEDSASDVSDDGDVEPKKVPYLELVGHIEQIQCAASSLQCVRKEELIALESLRSVFIKEAMKNKKQRKITDFFGK